MELRTVTTFVRVAELQSFSRAAQQLGYSQSAVTVQVKQLEQELGTQLFERIGKQVKLTRSGDLFLSHALKILDATRSAIDNIRSPEHPAGKLRVGTAESLLISVLPPILMEFSRLCPQVELSTCTGSTDQLIHMIRQNDVDLIYFLDRKTNFPEWVKVLERQEAAVFVASADHPLARERNIPLERLLQEPFLLTEKGISYRYTMEQVLAADGVEIHPFLETGNTDVITKLLLHNTGVSFLPQYVVREAISQGKLVALDTACPEIQMWSQLVYHKNKWVTPQMEVFLELMAKHLAT